MWHFRTHIWTDTCRYTHHRVLPYHALSLKEMGAVPGGAFRAFWEPVYRISISASTIGGLYQTQVQGSRQMNSIFHHSLTLLVHKNWCCSKWSNCVDQEEAVMSAGGVTVSSEKYDFIVGNYVQLLVMCSVWDKVGASLSADVSNAVYWVTEASRGLSVCEEKQDRLVFFYGLQTGVGGKFNNI